MVFPLRVAAEPYTYYLPMEMHEGMLVWPVRLSTGFTPRNTDVTLSIATCKMVSPSRYVLSLLYG